MSSPSNLKFESPVESLADSFVSTPGTLYPPLFDKMDDEVMTPQSFDNDSMFGNLDESPAPEKKPVKKRKSWGQQLPEPKTNLPPRKRAKTEDEKEQRRVERVLRNRRAAQSSRERKRQEVEALEARMKEKERFNEDMQRKYRDLEMQLADAQAKNLELQQQLELATGGNITAFRGSAASSPAHTEQFRAAPSPVTFSQELFSSRDSAERASFSSSHTPSPQTVNPASLSPEIRPVAELTNASSSDMTQHPAAMLCFTDLQCQSEEQRPWTTLALSQRLAILTLITTITAVSSTLLASVAQIIKSLQTKCYLSPTASILTTIIWLTTTTASLTTLPSRNSSTTTRTTNPRLKLSLRIRLLNHLLACNPHLARPLMDATREEMRLVSEQQLTRDCLSGVGSSDRLDGGNSPSIESLMTLLWATYCFEKKHGEASKLDKSADESRQERGELDGMDGLFRQGTTTLAADEYEPFKKSLGGWRLA